jgi:hypothetical protein
MPPKKKAKLSVPAPPAADEPGDASEDSEEEVLGEMEDTV